MPLKNRIKKYVGILVVILILSIFLTLRVCTCPDESDGCADLSTLEFLKACLAPAWRSIIWDAIAGLSLILAFRRPSAKLLGEIGEQIAQLRPSTLGHHPESGEWSEQGFGPPCRPHVAQAFHPSR